ncbi:MAG: hypothetical protein M1477_03955, partial [Candidatus Thermoplasmatota archaeon]|nr:hypothetical protein [Candidatus Thermoplasmatota archaeon]
ATTITTATIMAIIDVLTILIQHAMTIHGLKLFAIVYIEYIILLIGEKVLLKFEDFQKLPACFTEE